MAGASPWAPRLLKIISSDERKSPVPTGERLLHPDAQHPVGPQRGNGPHDVVVDTESAEQLDRAIRRITSVPAVLRASRKAERYASRGSRLISSASINLRPVFVSLSEQSCKLYRPRAPLDASTLLD